MLVGFGDVVGAIEVEDFLGGESGGEEGVGEGVGLAIAFLGALEDGANEAGGEVIDGGRCSIGSNGVVVNNCPFEK